MEWIYSPAVLLPPQSECHKREFVGGRVFPLSKQSFLLNPAHALHGGFLTLRLCVSLCVSVDKISQKVFNQSTSFFFFFLVGAFPVTQGRND